jgi:hypothetical protein
LQVPSYLAGGDKYKAQSRYMMCAIYVNKYIYVVRGEIILEDDWVGF